MGASMNGGVYMPSRPSSPSNNRGSVNIYPPPRINNEGRSTIFSEGETFFNGGGLPAQQPNSGVGKYSFGGRGSPSPPRFPWSGISAEIKQNGGVFSGHFGPSGGSGAPGAEGGEAGEGTGAEPEPIDCEMPTTEAECVSSDCCWDGVECDDPGEVPGCTAGGMGEPAGSAAPELREGGAAGGAGGEGGAAGGEGGFGGEGGVPTLIDCRLGFTPRACKNMNGCVWFGDNCYPSTGGRLSTTMCDPTRMCSQVQMCVGEYSYGTSCGPSNCDRPIGLCSPEPYLKNTAPDAKSNSGNKKVPVELHSFLLGVASVLFLGALLTGFLYAKNRKPRSEENVNLDYRLV